MPSERGDLNLFRVFDAVMRHRNLVAAGRELGISASAVSHALTRLRASLGDDLFVAGARGMTPTARAVEIAAKVAAALAELDEVLAGKSFDPATADRTIKIGVSDYNADILLPWLLQQVLQQAPRIRLRVVPIGRSDLVEQLDEGRLDVVVSWFGQTPARIRRKELYVDREAIVVRHGHPLHLRGTTKAALLSFPHLVIELTGSDEVSDNGFSEERGVHRRVWIERLVLESKAQNRAEAVTKITVPNYNLVSPLLQATDLIATLPLRLAQQLEAPNDLLVLDPPYTPLEVRIDAAWHERSQRDPALQWLLGLLEASASRLGPLPTVASDTVAV